MSSRQSMTFAEAKADTTVASQQRRSDQTRSGGPSAGSAGGRDLLVDLQRAFGNRHVQRMVQRTRRTAEGAAATSSKLVVGPADDRHEQEADRIAEQVAGPVAAPAPAIDAEVGEAPPWVGHAIDSVRGGQHVPDPVRSSMERALGVDLRGVRVHTDEQADQLNGALQAEAFTSGQHVFFRRGAYAPQNRQGQSLLAHELTHVMQQAGGKSDHAGRPQGLIQRKLSFKASRMKTFVSPIRLKTGIFDTLYDLLKAYEAPNVDVPTQLRMLQNLEVIGVEWLGKHGSSTKGQASKKAPAIRTMLHDVQREIEALLPERQRRYLERVRATSWATFPGDQTTTTTTTADEADLAARERDVRFADRSVGAQFNYITKTGAKAMSLFGAKHQAAKQSGQGLLLTEDELAAIRVFSAGDYKYMNPVQAGSGSRLVGQIKNLSQTERNETSWASDATRTLTTSGVLDRAHTRQLKVEALQHVRQAMTGLNKLPDFAGTLFRGLRVPATDLQREYQQGCIVSFPSLTSTSKDRSVSNQWAQTPIADTTGILLVLSGVTQGKDIANISMNEVEKEVLLLAGSRFLVTEAPTQPSSNGVWVVKCTQVDAGSTQIGPLIPPAPTTGATASTANTSSSSSSSSSATATTANTSSSNSSSSSAAATTANTSSSNSSSSSATATSTTANTHVTTNLTAGPPPAPAYAAPPSASTTTTTTQTIVPLPPLPTIRRGRREAVRGYTLAGPLVGPVWIAPTGATIVILQVSDDRSSVQVELMNTSLQPQWVDRDVLEAAFGRPLNIGR